MNISTFNSFKSRNFRLFFAGQSVSLIGTWMQKTAVSWVVYSLTHSKFMLGLSLFASMFPSFVFSFLGGVAADRYDRYKLLLLTQVASMVQAVLLTILIFAKHYNVWDIIGLSVLLGIINAFDVPARHSLVYEMVEDKKNLPNALALNSSMVNLSRLIGPAIAGLAIEKLGDGVCFGLNALSFIAVIISLLMMTLPPHVSKPRSKNVWADLKEGLIYIQQTPSIAFVISMLTVVSLLVLPFTALIPAYAKDIFNGTAATFGVIDGAVGLGSLACAIFLASLKPGADLGRVLAVNTLVMGAGVALFSYATYYPLALLFITIAGFGMMSQITITHTIIQTRVAHAMRGRVTSIYAMAFFGVLPIGGLIIGWVSEHVGVQNTMLAEGLIALIIGAGHLYFIQKNKLNQPAAATAIPSEIEVPV